MPKHMVATHRTEIVTIKQGKSEFVFLFTVFFFLNLNEGMKVYKSVI